MNKAERIKKITNIALNVSFVLFSSTQNTIHQKIMILLKLLKLVRGMDYKTKSKLFL